jgi:hypothetical protein
VSVLLRQASGFEGVPLGQERPVYGHLAVAYLPDLKGPHLDRDVPSPARSHIDRLEHPISDVAVFDRPVDVALPRLDPSRPRQHHFARPARDSAESARRTHVQLELGVQVLIARILAPLSEHGIRLRVRAESFHHLPDHRDHVLTLMGRVEATHDLHVLLRHRPRSIAPTRSGGQADGTKRIAAAPHRHPGHRPGGPNVVGLDPVTAAAPCTPAAGQGQGQAPEPGLPGGRAAWVAGGAVAALHDQAPAADAWTLHHVSGHIRDTLPSRPIRLRSTKVGREGLEPSTLGLRVVPRMCV